ncbi:MAG: TolC family protein [Candidatus Omnitrophica bacterium]|nr:TolC family protein [Candidatus Omnitrophota bacterium]
MKETIIIILFCTVTVFFLSPVFAQTVSVADVSISDVFTLENALEEARIKNPEIAATRRRWEAEKAKIWVVKTWPDPELGVEFWGRQETWYDVGQRVPFPGKLRLKGKAQEYEARQAQGIYLAKEKEILEKVKTVYYAYFLVTRQIEILEESAGLLSRFSKVAENKYSVNKTPQSDVLKAQVEYFKSLNALVTLKQDRETLQAELNALLNRKPDVALGQPVEPALTSVNLEYEDLSKIALEKRPELFTARHQVEGEKAMLASAWADFLPDANFQYSRRQFDSDQKDDNIFILKFNVPAWVWGKGANVDSARKSLRAAEEELRSVENTTYYDVKSALVRAQTARRLIELYQSSVLPQAETSLKVSTAGYEAGTVGFLDLLDSERTWLGFQMEYYEFLARYWTYIAVLERLVGEDLR